MKKLLIFMLVFVMASLASGAIEFGFDPSAALPGANLTIAFVADTGDLINSAYLALISDGGYGGTATPGAWNILMTVANDPGVNGSAYGFGIGEIVAADGAAALGVGVDGLLYDFTYAIPTDALVGSIITFSIGDIEEYGLISGAYNNVGVEVALPGALGVHVIPEPMTVLLLGLGGLFLRRRKGRS